MLRPEIRRWYGAKHRRRRSELIALLGPICQKCKREHPRINFAHLTHDATDVESVTLFCPSCHAKYDARQRHAMTRRTLARRRGQLWFNAALEYAPFGYLSFMGRFFSCEERATRLGPAERPPGGRGVHAMPRRINAGAPRERSTTAGRGEERANRRSKAPTYH